MINYRVLRINTKLQSCKDFIPLYLYSILVSLVVALFSCPKITEREREGNFLRNEEERGRQRKEGRRQRGTLPSLLVLALSKEIYRREVSFPHPMFLVVIVLDGKGRINGCTEGYGVRISLE